MGFLVYHRELCRERFDFFFDVFPVTINALAVHLRHRNAQLALASKKGGRKIPSVAAIEAEIMQRRISGSLHVARSLPGKSQAAMHFNIQILIILTEKRVILRNSHVAVERAEGWMAYDKAVETARRVNPRSLIRLCLPRPVAPL